MDKPENYHPTSPYLLREIAKEYGQLQNFSLLMAGIHEQLQQQQDPAQRQVLTYEAKYTQIAIGKCKKAIAIFQAAGEGKYKDASADQINETIDCIRATKHQAINAASFFSDHREVDGRFHERLAMFERQLKQCEENESRYGIGEPNPGIILAR